MLSADGKSPFHVLACCSTVLCALLITIGTGGCASSPTPANTTPLRDADRSAELLGRARTALEDGDRDRAASLIDEAIRADPFNGKAINNRGVLALERGDLAAAAADFDNAARLRPDDPAPRINLGLTLAEAGRGEEAVRVLREAVEIAPRDPEALAALVSTQIRFALEDETTIQHLRTLQRIAPDPRWNEQLDRVEPRQ